MRDIREFSDYKSLEEYVKHLTPQQKLSISFQYYPQHIDVVQNDGESITSQKWKRNGNDTKKISENVKNIETGTFLIQHNISSKGAVTYYGEEQESGYFDLTLFQVNSGLKTCFSHITENFFYMFDIDTKNHATNQGIVLLENADFSGMRNLTKTGVTLIEGTHKDECHKARKRIESFTLDGEKSFIKHLLKKVRKQQGLEEPESIKNINTFAALEEFIRKTKDNFEYIEGDIVHKAREGEEIIKQHWKASSNDIKKTEEAAQNAHWGFALYRKIFHPGEALVIDYGKQGKDKQYNQKVTVKRNGSRTSFVRFWGSFFIRLKQGEKTPEIVDASQATQSGAHYNTRDVSETQTLTLEGLHGNAIKKATKLAQSLIDGDEKIVFKHIIAKEKKIISAKRKQLVSSPTSLTTNLSFNAQESVKIGDASPIQKINQNPNESNRQMMIMKWAGELNKNFSNARQAAQAYDRSFQRN